MAIKLQDSVIVITGASSGIGRATALECARRGANVVAAARRQAPLDDLAAECMHARGQVFPVTVDVTDEPAVEDLARRAVERFGRIDVWVNNAGVMLFSRFEDAPPDVYRQVIETNLFGYIHGARAALPRFREQGSGILINNASVYATLGVPYLSAYNASKFAIRGFSESLRQEVRDADDIHVCTILPASIDTPIFEHAANYTNRRVKPVDPIYTVDKVAATIVDLIQKPRREVTVGNAGRLLRLQHKVAPALYERAMAVQADHNHFTEEPARPSAGTVLEPMASGTGVSGGWKSPSRVPKRRLAAAGLAAAVPAALAWWRLRIGKS